MNHQQILTKDMPADLSGLKLDPAIPPGLRAAYIQNTAGTLSQFHVGGILVSLEFTDGAPPLSDVLAEFLHRRGCGL